MELKFDPALTIDRPADSDETPIVAPPPAREQRPLITIAEELSKAFASRAEALDAQGDFPTENVELFKNSDLQSMAFPRHLGGRDASMLDVTQVLRILASGCPSTALIFNMHFALSGQLAHMARIEPDGVWKDWIARIVSGRLLLGGALSESGSWNAVMFPNATAERVDGGYRVNANRSFCTGSSALDLIQGTALETLPDGSQRSIYFLFEPGQEGVAFKDDWDTMGMRGSHSQGVRLTDTFIPDSSVLYIYGYGALDLSQIWLSFLAWSFIGFAAVYAGIGIAARDLAVGTVGGRSRLPGTHPLSHKSTIQMRVAQADILNATMTSIREDVAKRYPIEAFITPMTIMDTAIAKYVCVTGAPEVVDHAMGIVGGQSYFKKMPLERMLRDVRAGPFHPFSADDTLELLGKFGFGIPFLEPGGWAL
jgi:alkylation response protein AidB-like acyl-CoA dehydrogenase